MGDTRITRNLEQARLSRRSRLYRWLWAHYDEVAPHLPPLGALPSVVAEVIKQQAGISVSRQNLRATWDRVQADKAKTSNQRPAWRKPEGKAPSVRPDRTAEPDKPDRGFRFNPATTEEDRDRILGKGKPDK